MTLEASTDDLVALYGDMVRAIAKSTGVELELTRAIDDLIAFGFETSSSRGSSSIRRARSRSRRARTTA